MIDAEYLLLPPRVRARVPAHLKPPTQTRATHAFSVSFCTSGTSPSARPALQEPPCETGVPADVTSVWSGASCCRTRPKGRARRSPVDDGPGRGGHRAPHVLMLAW